ncbi:hypothetical protein RA224_19230 [Achromobacter aegrifaciens]|uniref:hypothetical protein n=1 Tax=Achromobacter aegrifaciens TaxID=1287736 RepID=UPI0027B8ECD8|nr:hypothetical protein [Achromobacter aegrifaciens]WLW59369.1 hypothetical protein RA224_19230 [Achromobacter aegrifaciens]
MTATPPDPLATQHGSTPDPDTQAPMDAQTLRLREENRALRELLVAQAQAAPAPQEPGPLRRMFWWLISAPGAALVRWRALVGREDARPITGKRVGYATLTVLYTLAIYGALVLLVVSWSSPNTTVSGATAAGPVRIPLTPAPPSHAEPVFGHPELTSVAVPVPVPDSDSSPDSAESQSEPTPPLAPTPAEQQPASQAQPEHETAPRAAASPAADTVNTAPKSTLRVTEIPAADPMAWVEELKGELARCATLGFFDRPDCAWAARAQFCEPNRAWGTIKECPNRP